MLSDFTQNQKLFNEIIDTFYSIVPLLEPDEITTLNSVMELGISYFKVNRQLPAIPVRELTFIKGNDTTVETPQRSIEAFYSIVELDDLIPSHNPKNFSPDERYPLKCQQRDYTRDEREQYKVTNGAEYFNSKYVINDAPTATDGAPIVSKQGFVLGGNGRTMMMKLLSDKKYDSEYVTRLSTQYRFYGFTYEQFDSFKKPVLVRVVNADIKECALYSNILNQNLTQDIDITTKTVSFARQLDDRDIDIIGDLFEQYDGESLAEMLNTPKVVKKLQEVFRKAEIITAQNAAKFLESNDEFTSEGKAAIEGTLLGVILDDKELIESARSFTEKLIRTLPLLLRMKSLGGNMGGNWNLTGDIINVIRLESSRRASRMKLEDYLSQVSMDRPQVSKKEELLWRILSENSWLKWKNFLSRFVVMGEEANNQAKNYGGFFNEPVLTPDVAIERLSAKGLGDLIADFDGDKAAFMEILEMYSKLAPILLESEILELNAVMKLGMEYWGIEGILPEYEDYHYDSPKFNEDVVSTSYFIDPEKYAQIVRQDVLDAKMKVLDAEINDIYEKIDTLDTKPDTWEGTKKEWREKNAAKREKLARERDAKNQEFTRLRNDQLTDEENDALAREIHGMWVHNPVPTEEQVTRYIKHLESVSFDAVKGLDYFPTPPDIVERMLDKADLKQYQSVLEPSAGKGNIADALRARNLDLRIDVGEYSDHNRTILELKGYNIVSRDFLEYGVIGKTDKGVPIIDPKIRYDRIVMNPPFQNGMDWVHIQHAYKLLKPYGKLVALAPAQSYLSNSREATERRLFIEETGSGTIEIIEAEEYNRTMEFSPISIRIALITINKANEVIATSSSHSLDFEADSKYQDLPKKGSIQLPERTDEHIDREFVKPKVVTAQEHLVPAKSSIPNHLAKLQSPKPFNLFDYQEFGCNLAINALCHANTGGGFLLADGTGTGKTTEMLTIAAYTYQQYKKPVVIFTVDDRVIKTSFMSDALRMGFNVPEYVAQADKKEVPRPANYKGLYDKLTPGAMFDDEENFLEFDPMAEVNTILNSDIKNPLPTVYLGDARTFKLRDGINIFKYTALSLLEALLPKHILSAKIAAVSAVKTNNSFWDKIQAKGKDDIDAGHYDDVSSMIHVPSNPKLIKKKELKQEWAAKVEKARLDDTFILQRKFADTLRNIDKNNVPFVMPQSEKTGLQFVKVMEIYEAEISKVLQEVTSQTSLVIFDEAHKIKNLLNNNDVDATMAFYAKIITDNCERVLLATATPCDRPYDILYLKRAGFFQDDKDFELRMGSLGIVYQEPLLNSDGQVVKKGKWVISNQDDDEIRDIINFCMAQLFTFVVRRGCMIRRELQYTNLTAKFVDVTVPESVRGELEAITQAVTTIDKNGKAKVDKLKQMQRHLEHMEAYKIEEAINITIRDVAEGKNVIIFTNYVDEGDTPRKEDDSVKLGTVRILKNRLAKLYGEEAVGVLVSADKGYEDYRRLQNVDDFQTGKRRILIGTITSGGTGVNLDDTVGNAPRSVIIMTAPLSFINVMQAIGRVVRAKSASRSTVNFLFAKTDNPDPDMRNIVIELWLKRLIGYKSKTLKASVEGEIGSIDPSTVERMEAGGAEAVATSAEEKSVTPNKHTLYTQKEKIVYGWKLPSHLPLTVERYGDSREHTCIIKGKSKIDIDNWASANKEFIEKWELVKNVDKSFQVYNGTHYGRKFQTLDNTNWRESFELWNAMLNIVKPEEARYLTGQTAIFNVGETVVATTDILVTDSRQGDTGKIISLMKVKVGKNTTGDIFNYEYDVEFNGRIANNLQPWQIASTVEVKEDTVVKPKYNVGDVYYVYRKHDYTYTYYKILSFTIDEYNDITYTIGGDIGIPKEKLLEKIDKSNKRHARKNELTEEEIVSHFTRYGMILYKEGSLSGLSGLDEFIKVEQYEEIHNHPLPIAKEETPADELPQTEIPNMEEIMQTGEPPQPLQPKTPEERGFHTGSSIIKIKPKFIRLNRTKRLFDNLAKPFRVVIYGKGGSGKSSLSLELSEDMSINGQLLYLMTDEKIASGRIGARITRLHINHYKMTFNDKMDYFELKEFLINNPKVEFIVIDSVNELRVSEEAIVDMMMKDFPERSFVFICQSTKDGKNHAGFPNLAFKVDTVVKVDNLIATCEKHRDGPTNVDFAISGSQAQKQNKPVLFNGMVI